jgi:hypothetical protein
MLGYRTLSSSPCASLVVKATVLRRGNLASVVAVMIASMIASISASSFASLVILVVAGFPRLILTKLILRLLIFFFIVANGEWLIQVV